MKRSVFILFSSLFLIAGCSVYTFNPKGKAAYSSIGVERFANRTGEYGLEDRMTDQIIDALIADGSMDVVPVENAQVRLEGTLTRYERSPYNPDQNDQVSQYAVTMYFEIMLINSATDSTIWVENINKLGVYNVDDETEDVGQLDAIDQLVEYILNKTTKNW